MIVSSSRVVISAAAADSTSSRVSRTDESRASVSISAALVMSSLAKRVMVASSRRSSPTYSESSMTSS